MHIFFNAILILIFFKIYFFEKLIEKIEVSPIHGLFILNLLINFDWNY